MSQVEFTLTGWKAVAAVIVVAVLAVFSLFMRNTTLDSQGKEVIRKWVASDYARQALAKWEGTDYSKDPDLAQQSADEILNALNVAITSIKAKGGKQEPIVRVEILVDGKPPADGKGVRYYQMKFSPITGWTMGRQVSAFSYYAKIF